VEPTNLQLSRSALEYLVDELLNNPRTDHFVQFEGNGLSLRVYLDASMPGERTFFISYNPWQQESFDSMAFSFPMSVFPEDITEVINLSYNEALTSYRNQCYLATIVLCGKVIETVLGTLYERTFNKRASDEKLGINAIINQLNRAGFAFSKGIKERMEIIAEHRNTAAHGNISIPTRDEARSVIYLTRDVMAKAIIT